MELQLRARGITDAHVLRARHEVLREEFVPPELVEFAYEDSPLPIGEKRRLERAIGVVLPAETEMHSHYFYAILPLQFDEYIWFDETHAVIPLSPKSA